MRHTSSNQVNIQIKLCVHPNIISKGTKAWIKRFFKVVTWLGSKRRDICGKIEFKRPSIREHSSIHIQNQIYKNPLNSKHNLVLHNVHFDLDNLFYFWIFFFLFFFSFSLSCTHFFFFLYLQQCCLDQN